MTDFKALLGERLEEIRKLIAQHDLSLATRRMLDFITDFDTDRKVRDQAIRLRADYNMSLQADEPQQQQAKQKISNGLLSLLDELHGNKNPGEKTPGTFEELQSNYLQQNKYLIYSHEENHTKNSGVVFSGKNIFKTYKSFPFTLSDMSIELKAGEITGVVGENGNGKTTLLRITAGELSIDTGSVSYPALNLENKKLDWYYIKQHIAYIPQQLQKWQGLLKDNLHFAAANHGIFGKENEEAVDFIIHRLGLTRYKNSSWKDISSGYRLRFELARALVWRPKLLILDEPLANLDINAKLLFMQDLKLLANSTRYPIAILMSSQQLHEIESVVDNIVFLREGKSVYNGSIRNFGTDRQTNTFEVAGNFNRTDLYNLLREFGDIKIEDTGQSFVIEAPVSLAANQVLALLSGTQKVDYFRDISQSTRKLFQN